MLSYYHIVILSYCHIIILLYHLFNFLNQNDFFIIKYKKATTVSIFVSFFIYIIILFGLIMFFSTLRKADNKLQCFKDMCPILCLTLCEYMWTCHSYFDN